MQVRPLGRKTYLGDHRPNNSAAFAGGGGARRHPFHAHGFRGLGDYYDADGNLVEDDSGYTPAPGETYPGGGQVGPTLEELQWGKALNQIAPNVTKSMQQVAQPGEDWLTTLQRVLQTMVMTDQQRTLFNAQIQRAQQGLPPLRIGSNGQVITGSGISGNTLLLVGGLVVAALALKR